MWYMANGYYIAFSFTSFNRFFLRNVSGIDKLTGRNTGSGFSIYWRQSAAVGEQKSKEGKKDAKHYLYP